MSENTLHFDGASFQIQKLLPGEAMRLFIHHVRPLLAGAAKANVSGEDNANQAIIKLMINAFTEAPADHYDHISRTMAQLIVVEREDGKRKLAGNESWAFQGLTGAHMIMVDIKAFQVNFTEWWDVLISEFPSLGALAENINMPTSIPSSPPSSTAESEG